MSDPEWPEDELAKRRAAELPLTTAEIQRALWEAWRDGKISAQALAWGAANPDQIIVTREKE